MHDVRQLRILPGAASAIKKINKMGFLAILVTNQSVIAHGQIDEKGLDAIHAVLIKRLGRSGASIDAIYYCPHHPEAKLKKYRVLCDCRKPNPGMIMAAAKHFDVSLKDSFMIGDFTSDILAGKRAKVKTIMVRTGHGGSDGKYNVTPDFIAKDLSAAVAIIQKINKNK